MEFDSPHCHQSLGDIMTEEDNRKMWIGGTALFIVLFIMQGCDPIHYLIAAGVIWVGWIIIKKLME